MLDERPPVPRDGAQSSVAAARARRARPDRLGSSTPGPAGAAVPRYDLYGESERQADPDFVHVESIPVRSSRHDWTIRPHSHPDYAQVLLATQGRATIQIEAVSQEVEAPFVVVVPADVVHGFRFAPGTDGFVASVASGYLDGIVGAAGEVREALAMARVYRLTEAEMAEHGLVDAMDRLSRELVWNAPARHLAIASHLQKIVVACVRLDRHSRQGLRPGSLRETALVQRFRELVEKRFRDGLPLSAYAEELGVTYGRLNLACRHVAGASALRLLHGRMMTEAQRNLLFTSMTVSQVAYAIGFADPAYFSRFFSARAGCSPMRFRAERRLGGKLP